MGLQNLEAVLQIGHGTLNIRDGLIDIHYADGSHAAVGFIEALQRIGGAIGGLLGIVVEGTGIVKGVLAIVLAVIASVTAAIVAAVIGIIGLNGLDQLELSSIDLQILAAVYGVVGSGLEEVVVLNILIGDIGKGAVIAIVATLGGGELVLTGGNIHTDTVSTHAVVAVGGL